MNLEATYTFDAPVERTWALLMDTEAIAACLPGCRGLRPAGDNRYEVELGVAIAAIRATSRAPWRCRISSRRTRTRWSIEGSGRQGFVKGQAQVTLEATGERTLVKIAAAADVGGTIARLGQRLVEGVARTTMERFYACLAKRFDSRSVARTLVTFERCGRRAKGRGICNAPDRGLWF